MMPRVIRRPARVPKVAALLALAVAGAVAAPSALACKCIPPSAATVKGADVVFTGTVTARSDPAAGQPSQGSIDPITFTLAVEKELKGDVDATAQVVTPRQSASCGVDFQIGARFLVVAHRDGSALRTGLCDGTQGLAARDPLPAFVRGLDGAPAPKVTVRGPKAIDQGRALRLRVNLSRAARIEVRVLRPGGGARVLGPVRSAGRAGANVVEIPAGRLDAGRYRVAVRAVTPNGRSCPATRGLVIRPSAG